jgi:hypothetical protein
MRGYRRNVDEELRRFQRAAATGDPEAAAAWTHRMVSLGRIEEVPLGYLRYLDAPRVRYRQELVEAIGRNRALAQAALSYWIRFAGDHAFRLHQRWAGDDAYGPRRTPADDAQIRRFAMWARVWVALLFLQTAGSGTAPELEEAYEAHWLELLAGGHVYGPRADMVRPLRIQELDPMIVAMYG